MSVKDSTRCIYCVVCTDRSKENSWGDLVLRTLGVRRVNETSIRMAKMKLYVLILEPSPLLFSTDCKRGIGLVATCS